jgi:hypothetical protein
MTDYKVYWTLRLSTSVPRFSVLSLPCSFERAVGTEGARPRPQTTVA